MKYETYCSSGRANRRITVNTDFTVVGGGLSGVCAAITAARQGAKVVLVQDRPVLGGNASSEVRLWALGATSHMGNNNRWSREGGVIEEILLENLFRNREGNPLILDTIILEKVTQEPNITLLLNTAVHSITKKDDRNVQSAIAFCSQNSIEYELVAQLFCDASGDGVLAFLAGAEFRMGAEAQSEFGEGLAPEKASSELLGHTLYFYSKRTEQPVAYVPPAYALKDITVIPRYMDFNQNDDGCRLWWIEYGGVRDTVYDTEEIKWELWKIVYGVWDHIKNSGEFPGVENLTLEWVGQIPGKRESRRFEGLYMLRQQDIVEQRRFDDAVAHGGWAIDIHPAEGVYAESAPCTQWHSKGIYQIPYRCYVARDLENLFFAGRIINSTHTAFGSIRVMLTCALGGQAVGAAAAMCVQEGIRPADILANGRIKNLQAHLNLLGQRIPHIALPSEYSLAADAKIETSSQFVLDGLPPDGPWLSLKAPSAQLLPLREGERYVFRVIARAKKHTALCCELRVAEKAENYSPECVLERIEIELSVGEQEVEIPFSASVPKTQYGFLTFLQNDDVEIRASKMRVTGIVSAFQKILKAVSNNGVQKPPPNSGVDAFEFWTPARRPLGHNIAFQVSPTLKSYHEENLRNGFMRPFEMTNAWVADPSDLQPSVWMNWRTLQLVHGVTLYFDADFDHALESSLQVHPERTIPFCVKSFCIKDANGNILHEESNNHLSIRKIEFGSCVLTESLTIELDHPDKQIPAALFGIVIHGESSNSN